MYWNSSNGQKVKELELLFGDVQIRNYLIGEKLVLAGFKGLYITYICTYVRVECSKRGLSLT